MKKSYANKTIYDPPTPAPHPWGEGGHLDLLWFPITQIRVNVIHFHPRLCKTLFMRYFLQFLADGFQILRYGDYE